MTGTRNVYRDGFVARFVSRELSGSAKSADPLVKPSILPRLLGVSVTSVVLASALFLLPVGRTISLECSASSIGNNQVLLECKEVSRLHCYSAEPSGSVEFSSVDRRLRFQGQLRADSAARLIVTTRRALMSDSVRAPTLGTAVISVGKVPLLNFRFFGDRRDAPGRGPG